MLKVVHIFYQLLIVLGVFVTYNLKAQSTFNQVYTILNSPTCGSDNSGCHNSAGISGLNFNTTEQGVYNQLYYQQPSNTAASNNRDFLVLPGNPYRSFLFKKINHGLAGEIQLGPGEGDNMPPISTLTEKERELIRQWIIYGAPLEGNVVDMNLINDYYDNGGIETVENPPLPPQPWEGFQLHLGPIFLPPMGESPEGGDYSRFDLNLPDTVEATRVETYAGNGVHHTTLFVYNNPLGIPDVPYGATELVPELMGMEILATYQFAPDYLDLPEGCAYVLPKNSPLIFNSHYFNPSQSQVRKCDTYFNVYTQPKNTAAQALKFGAHEYVTFNNDNPPLYIPPDGQEYTFEEFVYEPGNTDYRYVWAIIGHVHEYALDYDVYRRNPDGSIGEQLSDASCVQAVPGCSFPYFDPWHIPTRYFEEFEPIRMDHGFYHTATYVNHTDYPITWGPSAFQQEMMVFGYYYVTDTTGVTIAETEIVTDAGNDNADTKRRITIAPNPFHDVLTISSTGINSKMRKIELFNVLGDKIKSFDSSSHQFTISKRELGSAGVYLLRIIYDDGTTHSERIVATHR